MKKNSRIESNIRSRRFRLRDTAFVDSLQTINLHSVVCFMEIWGEHVLIMKPFIKRCLVHCWIGRIDILFFWSIRSFKRNIYVNQRSIFFYILISLISWKTYVIRTVKVFNVCRVQLTYFWLPKEIILWLVLHHCYKWF